MGCNRLLLDLLCEFGQILVGLVQQKLLVLGLRGRRLLAA
jgi:hypothetical protein